MPINFVRNPLLNPHEIKHTCLLLYSPLKIPDIDTQIQKLTHTYIQNGEREVRERERVNNRMGVRRRGRWVLFNM
jgi:hypothetical protein